MSAASAWGWRPVRSEGIWRHGCVWARPFTAAAPWIMLLVLMLMFALIEGRLAAAPGITFDLPSATGPQTDLPGLVALVLPMGRETDGVRETVVFFDDARYSLADETSAEAFRADLMARTGGDAAATLLLLADRHVPSGDVMRLVGLARGCVANVQVAEKVEARP